MYPPKFDYYRADSVRQAVALMKEHDGRFLAGGQSLIPVMNLRLADPGTVIDIGRIDSLKGIWKRGHMAGPRGERNVQADDFFVGLFETALQADELLVGFAVFDERPNTGSAYKKLPNPASRYAMVGAAAQVTIDNGKFRKAGVAVGGLTPQATRASSVEAALVGNPVSDETIAAAATAVVDDLGDEVMGDIHASADYRRQMAPVFVRRALETAVSRAR